MALHQSTAWAVCLVTAPGFLAYFMLAYILGMIAALMILPRIWLARKMYWSCPFIPVVFARQGVYGKLLRVGFEVSYTVNVIKRLCTLPLRRSLPSFYIVGFPVRLLPAVYLGHPRSSHEYAIDAVTSVFV